MTFHDPDALTFWINVFFAIAAASVAFAVVAITKATRQQRPESVARPNTFVVPTHPVRITGPSRHVA